LSQQEYDKIDTLEKLLCVKAKLVRLSFDAVQIDFIIIEVLCIQ